MIQKHVYEHQLHLHTIVDICTSDQNSIHNTTTRPSFWLKRGIFVQHIYFGDSSQRFALVGDQQFRHIHPIEGQSALYVLQALLIALSKKRTALHSSTSACVLGAAWMVSSCSSPTSSSSLWIYNQRIHTEWHGAPLFTFYWFRVGSRFHCHKTNAVVCGNFNATNAHPLVFAFSSTSTSHVLRLKGW